MSVTKHIMSAHRKDKSRDLKRFEGPKGHTLGAAQVVNGFSLNIQKLELTKGFFPWKTCKLLLVRGTISFYNQKLQILPVGESAMWNVSM